MLAIIEVAGKQYRVGQDQTLYVDLLDSEAGSEINIDKVLLVKNGDDVKVGKPYVESASIKAKVLEAEVKGPKINGFKYKRRKNYHRRWGHRQKYSKLQITSISA